jgi:hypothetical protein
MGSSRRTTGDINILAMLDGQVPGRRLRAVPAAFRYGAAGVLACSLLATLAWLVRDDTPAPGAGRDGAAQASLHHDAASRDSVAIGVPTDTAAQSAGAGAVATREAHAAGGQDAAVIVMQRGGNPQARDSIPVAVPAMRTVTAPEAPTAEAPAPLPGQAAASGLSATTPTRGAVIIDVPQPAPAAVPPAAQAATPVVPAQAAAGMAGAHAQPAGGHHAPARTAQTAPPTRPQPGSQRMPARAPSLAHTEPMPSRQKRGAAATRPASPAAVDTDVAVISAILEHTGARNEAAGAAPTSLCTDRPCATHMPSRQ